MNHVEEIGLDDLFDLDVLPVLDVPTFPSIEAGTSSTTACIFTVIAESENPYIGVPGYGQSPLGLCEEGDSSTVPMVGVVSPLLPGQGQVPEGYDSSWPQGTDPRGPFVRNPQTGEKWYPHGEDSGHWPHYDSDKGNSYPEKSVKPWPNQQKPPYGRQSPNNPWPKVEPPVVTPKIPWWERIPFLRYPMFVPIPMVEPLFENQRRAPVIA
jgi:hypothetical protein